MNQNTAVRRFLDPKVEIGDVSIRIRLFAFPSARRSRLMMFNRRTAVRLFLRSKVEIGDVSIRIRVFAFPSARASRLMMFQSECGCSSFSRPDRRNWSCSNQNTAVRIFLGPKVEIDDVSIIIRLFAVSSTRGLRTILFESEYGCSPFPRPES